MDPGKLNPPQREAVSHGSGPLLVLAGAGSGKTRVITHRVARLVRGGIPARAIAALTFTNKAASEMRERVAKLLGDRQSASQLTIGTFHALGLEILRSEHKALGLPRGFVIYDTSDQIGVVRELLRTVHAEGRRFDVKAILTRISLAKNRFIGPEGYKPAENDEYDEITAEIYPRYQAALRSYAAVDFDDLITETVRLLERDSGVRERWQRRFHHVLVDEYQDTNRTQLMMVQCLCKSHGNLCVVGDDDQSIYSWRGADSGNILAFEELFPGARIIKLEQNYRSTPTILEAANAVIANNASRHGKSLWSDRERGELIDHIKAVDPESEARFVALEIGDLVSKGKRRYRDLAVLYRSNVQSRVIEEELRTARIPYVMYGGQQFFERKEVKDVIAYLRLALQPRDEIALRRIINYPARGIGASTIDRINDRARMASTSMWRVLEHIDAMEPPVRTSTREAITSFVAIIDGVRSALEQGQNPAQIARQLIADIDLYGDLRTAAASPSAAQRRIEHIESLLASLERHHAQSPGRRALAEYLRQLSLASESEDSERDPGDKVVLTTLHSAKGLEFPVVFLIGLEEELLPHARAMNSRSTDVFDPDHVSDVSEERRLAYVGITRAEDRLYLSRSVLRRARGRTTPRTPSRFLLEIPAHLTRQRDAEAEARAPADPADVDALFRSLAGLGD